MLLPPSQGVALGWENRGPFGAVHTNVAMNCRACAIASFVIAAITSAIAAPVWAQAPKGKPPKAAKPAVERPAAQKPAVEKPAEKPAKRPPAEKPETKPGAKPSAAEESPASEDAAVMAILATKPTTPAECVRAAKNLADLGHADVAKQFLKNVIDAKLEPQQLADLGTEFGVPTFLDLAAQPTLLPEAKQLADAVKAAVAARLEDAQRITKLIGQLQDPSEEKRLGAMAALQEARRAAIGPLLAVLADPARANDYQNVRTVLAGMGRPARDALVAVVDGADPKLKIQAILTLAEMNNPKTAIDLVGPCASEKGDAAVRSAAAAALKQLTGQVPSRADAIGLLGDAARTYFQRRLPVEGVADGRVELWRWDQSKRQCVIHRGTPDDAARELAAHFARQAYALAPGDREIRLLYLATMLDAAAYRNGLDRPLEEKDPAVTEAKQFGVKPIEEVLAYAMAHGHPAAATVAARLLGEMGKADELLTQGGRPAPLVQAIQDPDRRLQMAALEAIVRLQPVRPYAGSSYVPSALGFLAASSGVRHALVGGPNTAQARDLATTLAAAHIDTDTAATGKELLRLATRSPDYEFAWIDVGIQQPEIALLMQELRRDPRTALLRVGLVARDGFFTLAEHVAAGDPMAKAFDRAHDDRAYRWQLEQLATLAPQEFVDFGARQQQAGRALDLLAELSRSSSKLYDLRRAQESVLVALYNPKLAVKAVAVLANLNSAESQRALVEVANRFTLPLELRRAAAKAFRENTQQHGILLTTAEIRAQYGRYNESEKLDAPTQHVLGLILDCLEARVKKAGVGARDSGLGTSGLQPVPNPTPSASSSEARTPSP
jgi:hypothetical protein